MSDLQQWLGALFGHWQHWLGGAGIGVGVALTVILVQRLFSRRVTWQPGAAIFLICFAADASYLAWHDQYLLNQSSRTSVAYPQNPPIEAPPAMAPTTRLPRTEASALAEGIMAFYASREVMQPRPPHGADPAASEWQEFGRTRDTYNRETLSEFKSRFGAQLTALLEQMKSSGIEAGEIEIVFRELSDPGGIKDIAVRLNALSKE